MAIINRRPSQRDADRDVLEKVTLIKDVDVVDPHRAHLDILSELSLDALYQQHGFTNFLELHQAWQQTLDTSELNRRFFKEIADWYFWAVGKVVFPSDAGESVGSVSNRDVHNATCVIRLITRLIFVWFLKEKDLVPNTLFNADEIGELLVSLDPQESTYYKAILQNLFFATLNQEMNTPEKPNNRTFRGEGRQHYNITSLYRYKRCFRDPEEALRLFETIPFLNGGLFECLDKPVPEPVGASSSSRSTEKILRIDGFSDRDDNPLSVPNELFFSEPQSVNLNAVYDTKNSRYTVQGLIHILNRYKFTIAENTPIEEEVALDPELLGQVFENLLAAYNPETGTTARKQTGSFYTPREVVNYMVDESLIAYLQNALPVGASSSSRYRKDNDASMVIETKLRHLLCYNDEPHPFTDTEVEHLIAAIDTFKILDPACGSGAFPMGILHKLVFLLSKLDPRNAQWRQRQIDRVEKTIATAEQIDDNVIRDSTIDELEREIESINEAFERNELDYGRKLYLIENCIYGVDIQPIATQIAKLRFFISLIVEQKIDDTRENRGVRPLPNLETKFVAANTLLDVEKPSQLLLRNPEVDRQEKALEEVRRRHFTARTPRTKDRYRQRDAELRSEISALLQSDGFPSETTEKIAAWDPYDQNATADFFDPEWMFGITEGFDVVIGNPPYIQLQKSGGTLGKLYKDAGFETFIRTGDIYCLFYERGVHLLIGDGHLCYITSNKWMRAGYGKNLRQFFAENIHLKKLLDLGPDIFDATVDTNILLCTKKAKKETESVACTVEEKWKHSATTLATYTEENSVNFPMPSLEAPWVIMTDIERNIKAKIESVGTPLKDWDVSIYRGIITGYNNAFLIDNETKEILIDAYPRVSEIIKPVLRGRDIKRYRVDWAQLWLVATHNGYDDVPRIDINDYPIVKRHLDRFYTQLEKRHDKGTTPYNLRNCAYHAAFEGPKIVYPETTRAANFFYDDGQHFIEKTCFMITGSNLKMLVGLLSSTFMTFAYKQYYSGTVLGTKGYQYNKHALEKLPVVEIPTPEHQAFIALVDQILETKAADSDADTVNLEKEIDKRVYALYDLTQEEIAIVEEAVE